MDIKTNIKVLIVDDFETARRTIRSTLKSIHFHSTEEAENGLEAFKKFQEDSRIRLILLDWNMPKMSGLEFLRELRSKPEGKKVKVIMITAETLQANIVTAIQAGVNQYIVKPVMPKTLEEKIISVMEKEFHDLKLKYAESEAALRKSAATEDELKEKIRDLHLAFLEEFKEASDLYPWKPMPHYEIGMVYLKLGQLLEARKKFETALEIDAKHEPSCIELSKILMKQKQGEKAIRLLSGLAALKHSSLLFQELGEAYLLVGDANKAVKAFNDSIQHAENAKETTQKQLAEKHEGLGNAFRKKFDETKDKAWIDKSVVSLEKSVSFDPNYISAHFNLISAYKKSGNEAKALELIKKTAEITPSDTEGWIALGKIYLENKEAPKAVFAFKRATELSGAKSQTFFEIGDIYEETDLETSLKYFMKSNQLMPGQSHVLNKIGVVNRKLGNINESIRFYKEAIEADPKDERIHFNLAFAYLKSNLPNAKDEAKRNLELALNIEPGFTEATELLKTLGA